jgi:hypothetical protein
MIEIEDFLGLAFQSKALGAFKTFQVEGNRCMACAGEYAAGI